MAWYATAWIFAAWSQDYGGVWVVLALIHQSNNTRKEKITEPKKHIIYSFTYWLPILLIILLSGRLIFDTLRGNTPSQQIEKQLQPLIENNQKIINGNEEILIAVKENKDIKEEMKKSLDDMNKQLSERLDKIIIILEQNNADTGE